MQPRYIRLCSYVDAEGECCTKQARRGGVCIKHGAVEAPRKLCSYADAEGGCTKLARRGGVCIRHGAVQASRIRTRGIYEGCPNQEQGEKHGNKPRKKRQRTAREFPQQQQKQREKKKKDEEIIFSLLTPPGRLGLSLQLITEEWGGREGALITAIDPACTFKSVLSVGDRILSIDGRELRKEGDLIKAMCGHSDGKTRTFRIAKKKRKMVGESPAVKASDAGSTAKEKEEATFSIAMPPGRLGLTLRFITTNNGNSEGEEGLIITAIDPSCIFKDELVVGDRVISIDGKEFRTEEDFTTVIKESDAHKTRVFQIARRKKTEDTEGKSNQQQEQPQTISFSISIPPGRLGLTLRLITAKSGINEGEEGVEITAIDPSCVFKDELVVGDRIISIDEKEVRTEEDFATVLKGFDARKTRLFKIVRRTGTDAQDNSSQQKEQTVLASNNTSSEHNLAATVIWRCDLCKNEVFTTFDDCVAHEKLCSANDTGSCTASEKVVNVTAKEHTQQQPSIIHDHHADKQLRSPDNNPIPFFGGMTKQAKRPFAVCNFEGCRQLERSADKAGMICMGHFNHIKSRDKVSKVCKYKGCQTAAVKSGLMCMSHYDQVFRAKGMLTGWVDDTAIAKLLTGEPPSGDDMWTKETLIEALTKLESTEKSTPFLKKVVAVGKTKYTNWNSIIYQYAKWKKNNGLPGGIGHQWEPLERFEQREPARKRKKRTRSSSAPVKEKISVKQDLLHQLPEPSPSKMTAGSTQAKVIAPQTSAKIPN